MNNLSTYTFELVDEELHSRKFLRIYKSKNYTFLGKCVVHLLLNKMFFFLNEKMYAFIEAKQKKNLYEICSTGFQQKKYTDNRAKKTLRKQFCMNKLPEEKSFVFEILSKKAFIF